MTVRDKIRELNAQRGRENRANGMKFEWKVACLLQATKSVLFVLNAKGSRGAIDVLAHYKNGKQVWAVVKKNGYLPPSERNDIEKLKKNIGKNIEIRIYREWGSKIIWSKA